ncbi:MAG: diaminopimelate epimerase [Flavobacteriaceae bacterium]|nr:diaminopimelate epimerase [Flavobacteriaceae bacterium]
MEIKRYIYPVNIPFFKFQGTGNDFVMIDNRKGEYPLQDQQRIAAICDRRFGVGADGVIVLQNHNTADFLMHYFNADGLLGSFCGNGGRCVVAFAKHLGIIDKQTNFAAFDGLHVATISGNIVSLSMGDVDHVQTYPTYAFLDTGSPHHVEFVKDTMDIDVLTQGAMIAHNDTYGDEGTNVNFVTVGKARQIEIRTFERGVENETLSCGTGVTAAALAVFSIGKVTNSKIEVHTLGGVLTVSFTPSGKGFSDIVLTGPTELVFSGTLEL